MAVSEQATAPIKVEKRPGILKRMWAGLSIIFASKIAMVGLAIVLFWIVVAIFAPLFTPYTPLEQDWKAPNQGPSKAHILGTDELGRDLWSRLIYGARVVLVLMPISENYWIPGGTAIWGVIVALIVGATLGLIGGYYGGWIDEIIMRLLDAMMAVPIILLYMIIMAALGASAINVVLAMTIVGTPGIARLVRSLTMDIRTREYIRAAETRGEMHDRGSGLERELVWRHMEKRQVGGGPFEHADRARSAYGPAFAGCRLDGRVQVPVARARELH